MFECLVTIESNVSAQSRTTLPAVLIEVWSDIACPWCYVGKRRFASALAEFPQRERVSVVWRSYQLAPETPVGARRSQLELVGERRGVPVEEARELYQHVARVAAEDGVTMDVDAIIAANTFDAHRLLHLAGQHRDELLEGLFRGYFTEGKALDDRAVLVEIAASAGLDPVETAAALDSDAGSDLVRADIETARQLQVSGVPFFVANRRLAVSGAQPQDVFTELLRQAVEHADSEYAESGAALGQEAEGCTDDSCAI
ncbi:putative DsbA family dithiol-disulfide isomerase [Prescottella agglutinans]|uniref:DsbA family dithiol-disulfide isomerase n=1 Tax=Prescottella agglutinans TaxID=1644129 RepID=A0ABT6MH53_9NOCA|nr:putative DsbA family dithiol-disulfide isomerase [Prescottella agglutinans]